MITDRKRDERYAKNMVLLISNILMLFLCEQLWHKQTFALEHSPKIIRTRLSTRRKMNRFTQHREALHWSPYACNNIYRFKGSFNINIFLYLKAPYYYE